jgi:4-hydroxybenzoate polyprenyltransferase/phosphoserine phosphatase
VRAVHGTVPPVADDVSTLPLCVDLDGTLIPTDLLAESLVSSFGRRDTALRLAGWLLRGRAHLKHRLAERSTIDPRTLPYNRAALAYVADQRARGRTIVLATAADAILAEAVARHLGLFDAVIASDGRVNVKGSTKAARLVQQFGEHGFVYMANSAADVSVWQHSAAAVLVDTSDAVAAAARRVTAIEARLASRTPRARAALRALRPHQWCKNLLVFVPLLTAHALFQPAEWLKAFLIFLAFSATASGLYVLNDIADLQADRAHPRKRRRPFASGALPVQFGIGAAPVLVGAGLALAAVAGGALLVMLYGIVSAAYSTSLKRMPLVDVFTLAGLYSLRLFGGGHVTGHEVSMWLLAFSSFLFLSLASVKRVGELLDVRAASVNRRAYSLDDTTMLEIFGVAASFSSSIVLALYVQSRGQLAVSALGHSLWAIVPLVLFWQCRIWLATARGYMTDDPIVYAARDWVSWLAAGCAAAVFIVARA